MVIQKKLKFGNEIGHGENTTEHWGKVYLLQEVQEQQKSAQVCIRICSERVCVDGHCSCCVRAYKWRRFVRAERTPNMQIVSMTSKISVAGHLHLASRDGEAVDESRPRVAEALIEPVNNNEDEIWAFVERTSWYQGLKAEEVKRMVLQGLCFSVLRKDYLACKTCLTDGAMTEFNGPGKLRKHFNQKDIHQLVKVPPAVWKPCVQSLVSWFERK